MRVGGKGTRVGWVVAKAKTKKQDNANGRVRFSSYCDVHMYPQWANNPLQGPNRCVLTVGLISGLI